MNPLLMAYANDAHLRAEQYAGTTAAFVLGRVNATQDAWQRCRDRGSEIFKYEAHLERPNNRISAIDEEIYMGESSRVPLWPYLDASGQPRSMYPTTKLVDIRIGSPWIQYALDHVAQVIRSKRYSGLFLDGFGGQLFDSADWKNWPAGERQEWTAGAVDLARRLDEMRRAEDPNFILVGNNHWDNAPEAEKYIDGIVSENHLASGPYWQRIVGKPSYSPLGHRRVFAITATEADALAWSTVPGVTHVCCTEENTAAGRAKYSYPTTPVVGYSAIRVTAPDVSAELAALREQLVATGADRDAAREAYALQTATLTETLAAVAQAEAKIAEVRQAARVWHQLGAAS